LLEAPDFPQNGDLTHFSFRLENELGLSLEDFDSKVQDINVNKLLQEQTQEEKDE